MKKLHLPFWEIDSDHSFIQFAQTLQSKFINGAIRVFPPVGSGTIKKLELERGLHLRAWNIHLNDAIIFDKLPVTGKDKLFHIVYVVNPETFFFKRKNSEKILKFPPGMNILFFSDDAAIDFEIPAGYHFQVLDISVTYSWLTEAFRDGVESLGSFITQLNEKPHPTTFLESSSNAEYRTMVGLHTTCLAGLKGLLHARADALSLLSGFFTRIFSRSPHKALQNRVLDHERMLAVEKILEEYMDGTLPGIEIIASRMAMSESTLKRHFKLMFGKNIYRYYLEMKMDFAKKILLEKPMRVNEVAALLNYDKVSNFIKMFKKRHGFSPGSLLKGNVRLNAFTT